MEQYLMPKELDFDNLRKCIDNHYAESIFIRDCGTSERLYGLVKVNESLENRVLDFCKDESGLHMSIDSKEAFLFPLKDYDKGFSLAYERFDKLGNMIFLSRGIDPEDPALPEPSSSILRTVFDNHLMEIYFSGRIPLKFHSWWKKPDWKYWTIA